MVKQSSEDLFREPGAAEFPGVTVRELREADLDAVVKIDALHTGRSRREYLARKIREATRETGLRISLAAEIDGRLAGFVLGRLYYGEFGLPEPLAILDSIGVAADRGRQGVAAAMLSQLETNLRGIGIASIQTQVEWDQLALLGFFAARGFRPAAVLTLQKSL